MLKDSDIAGKHFMHLIKKIVFSPWTDRIIRLTIGSLFVYAGFIKLIDPGAFAITISQYGIVPDFLPAPVAVLLPLLEFLAGLGLIFRIRGSLAVIFSLLIMFIAVLGYGILNDMNIDCGCFTADEIDSRNSLLQAFYRDIIMVGALFLLFLSKTNDPANIFNRVMWKKIKIFRRRNTE